MASKRDEPICRYADVGWTEAKAAVKAAKEAHEANPSFFKGFFVSPKTYSELPYKSVARDPNGAWHSLGAHKTFVEAHMNKGATHVVQTHGTSAEFEQQVRGETPPSEKKIYWSPLTGFFGAGGPLKFGRPTYYELPHPILTPITKSTS
jgi:hypothetical protein